MAIRLDGYYYNSQVARYINQFMSIFQGLQVEIGKRNGESEKLIPVGIHYAHVDRMVASILADNTQNKPLRLPKMSTYMSGLNINMSRARGVGQERRNTYVPTGGLVPDDIQVVHQRMPVPYDLTLDLCIYASNTNQHLQILEQILSIFDPSIDIPTSDSPFDWARLTKVELKDVAMEPNFPIGTDKRIIQSKLTFEMPIELATPAEVRRDFIEKIYLRIGTVSNSTPMSDSYDIIAELDGQGLPYELIATDSNLPFE
jgi:hypothetical protein